MEKVNRTSGKLADSIRRPTTEEEKSTLDYAGPAVVETLYLNLRVTGGKSQMSTLRLSSVE